MIISFILSAKAISIDKVPAAFSASSANVLACDLRVSIRFGHVATKKSRSEASVSSTMVASKFGHSVGINYCSTQRFTISSS